MNKFKSLFKIKNTFTKIFVGTIILNLVVFVFAFLFCQLQANEISAYLELLHTGEYASANNIRLPIFFVNITFILFIINVIFLIIWVIKLAINSVIKPTMNDAKKIMDLRNQELTKNKEIKLKKDPNKNYYSFSEISKQQKENKTNDK